MKCLVLAGGRGDRLWPLSRKNYPKQFIQIQKNHSIFQETIARNMPFCDEFIIVTNKEYRHIVDNQMKAFQGIRYYCVLEEEGRKTTAAIIMPLFRRNKSEVVFVVSSDHLISGEGYKHNILQAKQMVSEGSLVTIGMPITEPDTRFGYIHYAGDRVLDFEEKPTREKAEKYRDAGDYLLNSGMFLFRVGDLLNELRFYAPKVYGMLREADRYLEESGGNWTLPGNMMRDIPALPIENTVFEKTRRARVVHGTFSWKDVGSLEDLNDSDLQFEDQGAAAAFGCENTTIINPCRRRAVVANGLKDVIVVNTKDVVYVGTKGQSDELKEIVKNDQRLERFYESGRITYRSWGSREVLAEEQGYLVKKVVVLPGKTIYAHRHEYRTEHWSVVQGRARITIEGNSRDYDRNSTVDVRVGETHQVSNIGDEPLVIIEVATGAILQEEDMICVDAPDLTETELGYHTEPVVRLLPAFKDYLWGGRKLCTLYGKDCDYETLAESWELSAHPAGQSTVAEGRHKGMAFGNYLKAIGREMWGWKCSSMERFPIMVKFIDAREKLSVQVHPDDEYALSREREYGKNEMWFVLDAKPGAGIYCGFKEAVTRQRVEQSIQTGDIMSLLNWIPAKRGDVFFIPAGTVHAVGEGMLICEIQQSSDCTYRLYDYDRTDSFGMKRELHIDKALDVLNYQAYEPQELDGETIEGGEYTLRILGRCKYFESALCQIRKQADIQLSDESFYSLVCVQGCGEMAVADMKMQVKAGDSFFIPMQKGKLVLTGTMDVILTHV